MHDSKNALSVQTLISTLASTLKIMYDKDVELLSNIPQSQTESKSGEGGEGEGQWPWTSTWTTSFFSTVSQEWSGIDQWRINKYLLLIRLFLRQTFNILELSLREESISQTARKALLDTVLEVLRAGPLSSRERKVPDGMRLHVLDVWGEELERMGGAEGDVSNEDADDAANTDNTEGDIAELRKSLMQPIRDLAKEALSKSVRTRAKDVIRAFGDDEGN